MNTKNKSYPPRRSRAWRVADNAALWIDGQGELECVINDLGREFEGRVSDNLDKIQNTTTKTVKGKIYYYQWVPEQSKYLYLGREDPVPAIKDFILEIRKGLKEKEKKYRACIVTKIKDHYIVDLSKIEFDTKGKQIIHLSELIKLSKKTKGDALIKKRGG